MFQWPLQPTVHDRIRIIKTSAVIWLPPEPHHTDLPTGVPFRRCSFCSSIHPEDLLLYLSLGASLIQCDWEHGWPEKMYVTEIPNPIAGEEVEIGREFGPEGVKSVMGKSPEHSMARWNNAHLVELGDEGFKHVSSAISSLTGIFFERDGEGLKYKRREA